jgi:hypothetical protein
MSLDISLYETKPSEVFTANITHNLTEMASALGIYECLWRATENKILRADELIGPLAAALRKLKADPDFFDKFSAQNGWGTTEQFIPWLEKLLAACRENPAASIHISR